MVRKNLKLPIVLLLILAFVGLGLSVSLSQHYYELRSGTASFSSACNVSAKMNCDAVAASPYAELFGGLPISSFATGWYFALVFVYLIALGAFGSEGKKGALRVGFALNAWALALSAVYLAIMATKIGTYCLFCLGLDAINLISFLVVAWLFSASKNDPAPGFKKADFKNYAAIVLGCVFVAVIALKGMDKVEGSATDFDDMANQTLGAAPIAVNATPGVFPSIGPDNAPITIVEFSDFQCPFCRLGAMTLNTVLNRYPKDVRVVFRNFPLDMSCNPKVDHPMHTVSCEAARIGLCAQKQDKFEPFYDTVFENQADLVPGKPLELAKPLGLDMNALSACTSSPDTNNRVLADIEEATHLNVNSTPTFFVNGLRVDGVRPVPVWDRIIQTLLKNAHR
jgi:protein-disulfide isomerase/uncharacterized membrane protein